jgi:hypothetical protein
MRYWCFHAGFISLVLLPITSFGTTLYCESEVWFGGEFRKHSFSIQIDKKKNKIIDSLLGGKDYEISGASSEVMYVYGDGVRTVNLNRVTGEYLQSFKRKDDKYVVIPGECKPAKPKF